MYFTKISFLLSKSNWTGWHFWYRIPVNLRPMAVRSEKAAG